MVHECRGGKDKQMENAREEMGEGTLYDTGNAELADVAYRIQPGPKLEGTPETWGGELFFADETLTVDPGLFVLALEDGTQVDIDINPASVEDGNPRHVTFRGVGTFRQRIL